jgi:hypothetical protein
MTLTSSLKGTISLCTHIYFSEIHATSLSILIPSGLTDGCQKKIVRKHHSMRSSYLTLQHSSPSHMALPTVLGRTCPLRIACDHVLHCSKIQFEGEGGFQN